LALPEEMRALVLAGLDQPDPFNGRSDAILLVLFQPRLAKVSLVSVPPDLFGYLPGYTMQRLSSAYAVGGINLLRESLEYNLGIRPDEWLVANLDDFSRLVDDLGGLSVPVMEAIPEVCGDILYPGDVMMNGEQAACYARLRLGSAEAARGLRQQQLFWLVLARMAQGGNLVRLPELYETYRSRIDTNLTARDLLSSTELILRLGDPSRIAYFQLGPDQTDLWQISDKPPATVFLPRRDAILRVLEKAIAFASRPQPLSDVVETLQYELTTSPTPTIPLPPTARPAETEMPLPTEAPTGSVTPTLTSTPGASPTSTPTETMEP
jgi:LCP family protein required for cell wall assembly